MRDSLLLDSSIKNILVDHTVSTMDARAKFFARMEANLEAERSSWPGKDDPSESSDVDLDFSMTESGRTVAQVVVSAGKYAGVFERDEESSDGMDFSITSSGRTVEHWNQHLSERSAGVISIMTIEESGEDNDGNADNLSTASSARSPPKEAPQQPQQEQPQQFQPLLPLPEHPQKQKSQPRAIPTSTQVVPPSILGAPPSSQPSSVGSSGSAFFNNLLSPAASTFNNTQLSHTPPNHIATSYEASHFGKRARSGVRAALYFSCIFCLVCLTNFCFFYMALSEHIRATSLFLRIGRKRSNRS